MLIITGQKHCKTLRNMEPIKIRTANVSPPPNSELLRLKDERKSGETSSFRNTLRSMSFKRTFSRRSYISNLSILNKKNILRFGRSKIVFLIINFIVINPLLACDLTLV